MEEAQLKKQLKERQFSPVYLFYGEEPWLVRYYTAQIAQKTVEAFEEFNLQYFDERSTVDEIAEAVESLPMMSERKCVVVRNYDAETDASQTAKMKELLSDLPESCVLIFSCTKEIPFGKSTKWKNFRDAVNQAGNTVNFPLRDHATVAKFLTAFAKERGHDLSPDICSYLSSLCGNQLTVLENELEKVCAFAGQEPITRKHCDAVCVQNRETVAYRMANALTAGNYEQAYRLLDLLFYQRMEPIALLAVISSAYLDLYRARAAIDSGQKPIQLASIFGYGKFSFKLEQAGSTCRKMSQPYLRKCLEILYCADRELKSMKINQRVVLEKAIAKIVLITVKK